MLKLCHRVTNETVNSFSPGLFVPLGFVYSVYLDLKKANWFYLVISVNMNECIKNLPEKSWQN